MITFLLNDSFPVPAGSPSLTHSININLCCTRIKRDNTTEDCHGRSEQQEKRQNSSSAQGNTLPLYLRRLAHAA